MDGGELPWPPETRLHGLLLDLSPAQVVALERFLVTIRKTGRCAIVTDLDDMLTAFRGGDLEHGVVEVLAEFLAAGGVFVFNAGAPFDWFYYRLLRPLIVALGPRSRLLANVLLVLSGGNELYTFQDGAFRLVSASAGNAKAEGFAALVRLSKEKPVPSIPELDPEEVAYVGNSDAPAGIDRAMAERVSIVIDVGGVILETPGRRITDLHRGYLRTIDLIATATVALRESGAATLPECLPDVGDTALWTFERKHFPVARRLRVRVGASGYVHAGVAHADGKWDPVYNRLFPPRHGRAAGRG